MPSGWADSRLARMHRIIAGYVEHGALPGLVTLLARRGKVYTTTRSARRRSARRPCARDTIFRISSMSKLVTAVAAMILIEDCRLRLAIRSTSCCPSLPTDGC